MSNYNYVVDSHFKPYSLQEMLIPLNAYKAAYEEAENSYLDYNDKMDTFKYLEQVAKDNPDSEAAKIYKGYADEMNKQFSDFTKNGLNINNRRGLTQLKRRYAGEIGLLDKANTKLQEELKRRREDKDQSKLYGKNNLTIDDYLYDKTPSTYEISVNDLMKWGEEAGEAISKRMYSQGEAGSVMGGQYNLYKETQGMTPAQIDAFMRTDGIRLADQYLAERGARDNLSAADYNKARNSILTSMYKGIVYNESNKLVDNGEYTNAYQRANLGLAQRRQLVDEAENGITWVNGKPVYNPENSIKVKQAEAIQKAKNEGKSTSSKSSSGSGSNRVTQGKDRIKITWNGNNPADNEDNFKDHTITTVDKDEASHPGTFVPYDDLPDYARKMVDIRIGDGDPSMYDYYLKPYESGGIWNDQEAELEIVPRDVKIFNNQDSSDSEDLSSLFSAIGN